MKLSAFMRHLERECRIDYKSYKVAGPDEMRSELAWALQRDAVKEARASRGDPAVDLTNPVIIDFRCA
eukprot:8502990-Pyramimonas_sp.AAC.1